MKDQWEAHARQQAAQYGLDPELVVRQIQQESRWNPAAVSPRGAVGLMQLMPDTARELGVDPTDPQQNIAGGVRYLAQRRDARGGDMRTALADYNWGMGNVDRKGLAAMPPETRDYLSIVHDGQVAARRPTSGAPMPSYNQPAQTPEQNPFLDLLPPDMRPARPGNAPAAAPQPAGGLAAPQPLPMPQPAPAAPPMVPQGVQGVAQQAGEPMGPPQPAPQRRMLFGEPGLSEEELLRQANRMGPVGNALTAVGDRVMTLAGKGVEAAGTGLKLPDGVARLGRWMQETKPGGFDPNATSAKVGGFAGDMMVGTAAAGLAGAGVQRAATGLTQTPNVARYMDAAGEAIRSFGMRSGLPASTVGQRVGDLAVRSVGGAGAGAAGAAATDGEVGMSAAIGGAIPAVGMAAGAAGRTAADVVRPFTSNGRQQIAGQVLRDAVFDPAQVAARAAQRQGRGSFADLSLAEKTMDPGIAQLQRMLSNQPALGPNFAAFLERQNDARSRALLAGSTGANSPEALAAARRAAVDPLYAAVTPQSLQAPLNTMGLRQTAANIAKTPRFRTEAVAREVQGALTDDAALGIQRFGSPSDGWRRQAPAVDVWGARQNMDQRLYGGQSIDAKATAQEASAELSRLRKSMSFQLAKIPGFKAAEQTYAQMSGPIEAAEVLREIAKKGTLNRQDVFGNPMVSASGLTGALKNIDPKDWAKIPPAERAKLQNLAMELSDAVKASTLTMPKGSNTIQNALLQDNITGAVQLGAGLLPGGGFLQNIVGAGRKGSQDKIMGVLGEAMMDPAQAAALMAKYPRQQLLSPELQRLTAQGGAMSPNLFLGPR